MRNYKSANVRRKVVRVHSLGACPFPGKHPLRLYWSFQHHTVNNGRKVTYWGKFTAEAWKRYRKLIEALPPGSRPKVAWKLHDKAGEIGRGDQRVVASYGISWVGRYLWSGARPSPQITDFVSLRSVRVGAYWVYNTRPLEDFEQLSIERYIAAQIPHVRTA